MLTLSRNPTGKCRSNAFGFRHPFVCERPSVIGRPSDEIPDYCPSTPKPTLPPTPSPTPSCVFDCPPTGSPDPGQTDGGGTDGPVTIVPPEPGTTGAVTNPPVSDTTGKPTKDNDNTATPSLDPEPDTDSTPTAFTFEPTTTGTDFPPMPAENETNPCPISEDPCQWYHYAPSNKCFMVSTVPADKNSLKRYAACGSA